jgi:hypothetical protein
MKKGKVFLLLLGFAGVILAGEVKVKIPKQGWFIAFDSPALSGKQESNRMLKNPSFSR